MKALVAIPVMGSFEIGRISLYQWDRTASPDCHFLLIDNSGYGSAYPALFERGFLDPERWSYICNAENIGLVRSCQQAYEHAVSVSADILVLTHNDVWVYPESVGFHDPMGDEDWDNSLSDLFAPEGHNGKWILTDPAGNTQEKKPQYGNMTGESWIYYKPDWTAKWVSDYERPLGVAGLFGSKGCGSEGHRLDTFGSLIEMVGHGRQMTAWIEPAVCLDGFFLACSMKMLKEAGGFDQRYSMHHVYDYDISLTSIELGYRNAVINIPCHHLSGLTANNDAYATSGPEVHHANYQRWLAKWGPKLGVSVDDQWNYTWRCG